MEEPDRDRPANADAVGSKVNDPLTASFSSEDPDSWTLLGKGNDQLHSEPSGVQEIDKENVTAEKGAGQPTSKQRHDSHHSTDSQLDESSDGISVISECDTASSDKMLTEEESPIDHGCTVHFSRNINLKLPDYIPLTPPYTPDEPKPTRQETTDENKSELQIKRPEEQSIESVNSIVEHSHPPVSNASWVLFSLLATGMVAVLLGNSMRLQSRVEEVNFEHEKRISELELENNILKNEMNKLRHLYTRSELDEQVQRAEFEWRDVLNQAAFDETVDQKQDAELVTEEPVQTPIRKVPPQDGGVKRKVVWSGDEEEPMLIVDKDYVLPAFCYKQDQAVHDDLFAEYSAKYCDIKKRKIEAKQKKSEFHQKKQAKPENYNKFIHPKASEPSQEKRIDPSKPASPFNIDYQKAFDAIKAEGSVIVEALGSILDLSPDPEETLKANVRDAISPEYDEKISSEDEARTPTDTPVSHETEEQLSKCFEESGCEKVSGKQRYEDHKQRKYRENEYYRKEDKPTRQEEKEFIKQKDRASHEDGHKQRSDSREDVRQYDSKERKKEYHSKDKYKQKEPEKGYNKQKDNNIRSAQEDGHKQRSDSREEIRQYDNKERKKEYHEKDKYEQKTYAENYKNEYNSRNREDHHDGKRKHHKQHDNYRKNDHDDDDDDHHKKKFKQREEFKERDHKEKSYHSGHRDEQRRGSGERPTKQAYESGEGSYLEEFKRTEWTNGDRRHDDYEKHHKKHDRNQRRENDYWDEKRYKGRDEYRQNGGKHSERGSGDQHWQERMKHGRQAARDEQRQQMERDNNWYLERGTQREEDRMFPVPDSPTR